jgi:hypothetical protein
LRLCGFRQSVGRNLRHGEWGVRCSVG